jgi:hypothetical protein
LRRTRLRASSKPSSTPSRSTTGCPATAGR